MKNVSCHVSCGEKEKRKESLSNIRKGKSYGLAFSLTAKNSKNCRREGKGKFLMMVIRPFQHGVDELLKVGIEKRIIDLLSECRKEMVCKIIFDEFLKRWHCTIWGFYSSLE